MLLPRTVQSMPKYTECMAADKPFASISNKRMRDNITRAVSIHYLHCIGFKNID